MNFSVPGFAIASCLPSIQREVVNFHNNAPDAGTNPSRHIKVGSNPTQRNCIDMIWEIVENCKNVTFSSGGCVIVAFVKSLFFAQIFGTKIRSDPNTDEPSPRPYLLQSGGKLRRQWGRSLRV